MSALGCLRSLLSWKIKLYGLGVDYSSEALFAQPILQNIVAE
jgi:hypothetical protein